MQAHMLYVQEKAYDPARPYRWTPARSHIVSAADVILVRVHKAAPCIMQILPDTPKRGLLAFECCAEYNRQASANTAADKEGPRPERGPE